MKWGGDGGGGGWGGGKKKDWDINGFVWAVFTLFIMPVLPLNAPSNL